MKGRPSAVWNHTDPTKTGGLQCRQPPYRQPSRRSPALIEGILDRLQSQSASGKRLGWLVQSPERGIDVDDVTRRTVKTAPTLGLDAGDVVLDGSLHHANAILDIDRS